MCKSSQDPQYYTVYCIYALYDYVIEDNNLNIVYYKLHYQICGDEHIC